MAKRPLDAFERTMVKMGYAPGSRSDREHSRSMVRLRRYVRAAVARLRAEGEAERAAYLAGLAPCHRRRAAPVKVSLGDVAARLDGLVSPRSIEFAARRHAAEWGAEFKPSYYRRVPPAGHVPGRLIFR
jgi:hypothetical protein